MKKVLSLILAFTLLASLNTSVLAKKSEINQNKITDKNQLKNIIEEDNVIVPEGYELVEVTTYETTSRPESFLSGNISPRSRFGYYLVSKAILGEKYFVNDYLSSNWYDGPLKAKKSFQVKAGAKYTSSLTIKINDVTGSLGIESYYEATETDEVTLDIKDDETVNLKVFGNYRKHNCDVYEKNHYGYPNMTTVVGSPYAYEPIGLIFKQYKFKAK